MEDPQLNYAIKEARRDLQASWFPRFWRKANTWHLLISLEWWITIYIYNVHATALLLFWRPINNQWFVYPWIVGEGHSLHISRVSWLHEDLFRTLSPLIISVVNELIKKNAPSSDQSTHHAADRDKLPRPAFSATSCRGAHAVSGPRSSSCSRQLHGVRSNPSIVFYYLRKPEFLISALLRVVPRLGDSFYSRDREKDWADSPIPWCGCCCTVHAWFIRWNPVALFNLLYSVCILQETVLSIASRVVSRCREQHVAIWATAGAYFYTRSHAICPTTDEPAVPGKMPLACHASSASRRRRSLLGPRPRGMCIRQVLRVTVLPSALACTPRARWIATDHVASRYQQSRGWRGTANWDATLLVYFMLAHSRQLII
jgi:hypothetical protein